MVQMTPVGATSRWIAAARALETESEKPLFIDRFARALAGDDGFALLDQMRNAAGAMAAGGGQDDQISISPSGPDFSMMPCSV